MLYKNTFIKIQRSLGRYISLLLIVMVGVGFFAGLQATSPNIMATADQYYKNHNLMNFKIVSSMGLTDDDVSALKNLENVDNVIASYSLDVLDSGKVVRVHAIEESMNTVRLISGRMPKADNECLADSQIYEVGDRITITSDTTEKIKNTEFTVVGTVESVLYLGYDYGSSTIGDGKLSSFIFIDKSNFTMDAYSEVYIVGSELKNSEAYSKEYDDFATLLNNELLTIKTDREAARDQAIFDEANDEIEANQIKLNDEKTKAQKEFADAKTELDDNAARLKSGNDALNKNEAELQANIKKQTAEFNNAKAKIADGWKEIDAALTQNKLTKEEIDGKAQELNVAIETIKEKLLLLSADSEEYIQLSAIIAQYSAQYDGLLKLKQSIDTLTANEVALNQGIETFNSEIAKGKAEIQKGRDELAKNQKKLDNGFLEYDENLEKFIMETTDAQIKIDDARQKLSETPKTKWYISGRKSVVGYSFIDLGLGMIDSISTVLPFFFILIVVLMTSNTMSRMIEEERGELGTLVSLGYKDKSIIKTYLTYGLSATALGTIIGFFVGCTVFPKIIYTIKFILPPLQIHYSITNLLTILAVAFAVIGFVTIITCNKELKQEPASLMRPVPPKKGQTILLEKIGFIWNHLSFLWKVTFRNIFRYKKRGIMTIVGVAGCSALLLTGFGLKDSMGDVVSKQYGEIFKYNTFVALKEETNRMSEDLESLFQKEQLKDVALIKQTSFTCEKDDNSLDAYLVIPESVEGFKRYYDLKSILTNDDILLDDSGVIITQKMAQFLKVGKGDSITAKDPDNNSYTLTISDVAINYTTNYIYMTAEFYHTLTAKPAMYNAVVATYDTDGTELSKALIASDMVAGVSLKDDIIQKAVEDNSSMNIIVVLVIVISSLLAVIVLYNLTSINISERKREIATLKVLGFRDSETNSYIYKEALIMTIVGLVAGLLLGIVFHHFVVNVIEDNEKVLLREIHAASFILSSLITMIFSIIMQVVTHFKLKKIDMIESLKSVE